MQAGFFPCISEVGSGHTHGRVVATLLLVVATHNTAPGGDHTQSVVVAELLLAMATSMLSPLSGSGAGSGSTTMPATVVMIFILLGRVQDVR